MKKNIFLFLTILTTCYITCSVTPTKGGLDDAVQFLQTSFKQNPNRHVLEIIGEAGTPEAQALISSVRNANEDTLFLRENIFYRALVEVVKKWPKEDLHCHVSPSLSCEWVIKHVREKWDRYKPEFEKRLYDDAFAAWRKKNEGTVTLACVEAFVNGKEVVTSDSDKEIENVFPVTKIQPMRLIYRSICFQRTKIVLFWKMWHFLLMLLYMCFVLILPTVFVWLIFGLIHVKNITVKGLIRSKRFA